MSRFGVTRRQQRFHRLAQRAAARPSLVAFVARGPLVAEAIGDGASPDEAQFGPWARATVFVPALPGALAGRPEWPAQDTPVELVEPESLVEPQSTGGSASWPGSIGESDGPTDADSGGPIAAPIASATQAGMTEIAAASESARTPLPPGHAATAGQATGGPFTPQQGIGVDPGRQAQRESRLGESMTGRRVAAPASTASPSGGSSVPATPVRRATMPAAAGALSVGPVRPPAGGALPRGTQASGAPAPGQAPAPYVPARLQPPPAATEALVAAVPVLAVPVAAVPAIPVPASPVQALPVPEAPVTTSPAEAAAFAPSAVPYGGALSPQPVATSPAGVAPPPSIAAPYAEALPERQVPFAGTELTGPASAAGSPGRPVLGPAAGVPTAQLTAAAAAPSEAAVGATTSLRPAPIPAPSEQVSVAAASPAGAAGRRPTAAPTISEAATTAPRSAPAVPGLSAAEIPAVSGNAQAERPHVAAAPAAPSDVMPGAQPWPGVVDQPARAAGVASRIEPAATAAAAQARRLEEAPALRSVGEEAGAAQPVQVTSQPLVARLPAVAATRVGATPPVVPAAPAGAAPPVASIAAVAPA